MKKLMKNDNDRQTGRTTKAMQDAPHSAVFIWLNSSLEYPCLLAKRLGRQDLRIISPSQIEGVLMGTNYPVVVDHAVHLTEQQADFLRVHRPKQ